MIVRVQSTELSSVHRFVRRLVGEWGAGDDRIGGLALLGCALPRRRSGPVIDLLVWTPYSCTLVLLADFGSVQHGELRTPPAGRWQVGDRPADLRTTKSALNPVLRARKQKAELAALFRRYGLSEQIDILVVLIPKTGSRISWDPPPAEADLETILVRIGQSGGLTEYFERPPVGGVRWRTADLERAFAALELSRHLPDPETLAAEGFAVTPDEAGVRAVVESPAVGRVTRKGIAGYLPALVTQAGRSLGARNPHEGPVAPRGAEPARPVGNTGARRSASPRLPDPVAPPKSVEAFAGSGSETEDSATVPVPEGRVDTPNRPDEYENSATREGFAVPVAGAASTRGDVLPPETRAVAAGRRESAQPQDAVGYPARLGTRPEATGDEVAVTRAGSDRVQARGAAAIPAHEHPAGSPARWPGPSGPVRDPDTHHATTRADARGPAQESGGPGPESARGEDGGSGTGTVDPSHADGRSGPSGTPAVPVGAGRLRRAPRRRDGIPARVRAGIAGVRSLPPRSRGPAPARPGSPGSGAPDRGETSGAERRAGLRYPAALVLAVVAGAAVAGTMFTASGFARFDMAEYGAVCEGGPGRAAAAPYTAAGHSPVYLGSGLGEVTAFGPSAVWHPVDPGTVQLVACAAEVRLGPLVRTCQYAPLPGQPVGRTLNLFARVYRLGVYEARTGNRLSEVEITGDGFAADPALAEADPCRAAAGSPEDGLPGRRHSRLSHRQVQDALAPFVLPASPRIRAAR
ncbi:hypothetical protein [Nocardia sp. X0981]